MKWVIRPLKVGDHIRINRNTYFHHGVYIGNGEVIHFTGEDGDSVEDDSLVQVRKTSMDIFTLNGVVEVAEPSLFDKIYCLKPQERVNNAISHIGEKGYDFIKNNCEDFANRCCYKKEMTSQIRKKNC